MTSEHRTTAPAATGERLVPERQHGELVHAEHLARYRMALQLAPSRRVLDAACGTGYGTALLGAAASSAVGLDFDEATIAHAASRYQGCDFVAGTVEALPFEAGAFDLVVSFETIEHVNDPERALGELSRVLANEGVLAISTPNKHRYLVENEFHRREFFHEEFLELLLARFEHVELMLQQNWLTSAVLSPTPAAEASGDRDLDLELTKLTEMRAEQALDDISGSVWWRATAPPRRLVQTVRRRRGG